MISRRTKQLKKGVTEISTLCEGHLVQPEGNVEKECLKSCPSLVFKVRTCIFNLLIWLRIGFTV